MRVRIDGKRYDTDKATCLGGYNQNLEYTDYKGITRLYKKSTGEFFIYSCLLGKYGETSGEKFTPISITAAMEFSKEFLNSTTYNKLFC